MAESSKKLKKKIQGHSNALQAAEYENALEAYYANKRNEEYVAKIKDKQSEQQWKQNEEIRQLQIKNTIDQYDKSSKIYETTLDAIDLAAGDARQRVKLGLDEQIADFAFKYDDLERDMMKTAMDAGLQFEQKEQSLDSARLEDRINQQSIKMERRFKRTQFNNQLDQLELQEQKETTDYRNQQFNLAIENIRAKGQMRAKGVSGQTAARALTTADALNGINQQQMEDNLYFSQEALNDKKKLIQNERRLELGKDFKKVKGFGKMSVKKAGLRGGRLGLQAAAGKKRTLQQKKAAKREQDYISKTLGISQEEFTMSREKLAESLQSAAEKSKQQLKTIETKRFEARGKAYAEKMVAPRFGDAAPIPYKTPIAETIMPKPAPKVPMTPHGTSRGMQRSQSGFSTAAGIGSAALAIGAGFASGGTATALMGASGLLGGQSTLFN